MKKILKTVVDKPKITVDASEQVLNDFKIKIDEAIASGDPVKIAAAQLEVSAAQMQYLQRIDWKLWELYNKFINW